MKDFELTRRAIFERKSRRVLEQIDPGTGLIPGPTVKEHSTGAHSRASGNSIREAVHSATTLAMTGSYDIAWKALAAVLDHQDRDPRSFTYGNFFWWSHWTFAIDPNAISFIVPYLCYILRHREQHMPAELAARLRESLQLSVEGLNAHRATWGYTNIMLLNIAAKLLIGDVLNSLRATKLAYWDWEEWRNHTARLGTITEYNTVCYTTVQIDALAQMLTCRADPHFLREVRSVMRQLITASVIDYHPEVGRITGPQSRAYPNDRRLRNASGMDSILHFVLGTPEPAKGCQIWLGVALGPDDVLPCARQLSLPRTTRCSTHGSTRFNYLEKDFALGHISGRNHWSSNTVPFFLAYRSSSQRCSIPFMAEPPKTEGDFAVQRQGRMLAATLWMVDHTGTKAPVKDPSFGSFSGLCTGQPDNLIQDPDVQLGFNVELGVRPQIRILNEQGQEVPVGMQTLPGTTVLVETESVCVGIRFWGSAASAPILEISEEPDGEIILRVNAPQEGLRLNALEEACFVAFYLDVVSRTDVADAAEMARSLAALDLVTTRQDTGWQLTLNVEDQPMRLTIDGPSAQMFGINDTAISVNQWVHNLSVEN